MVAQPSEQNRNGHLGDMTLRDMTLRNMELNHRRDGCPNRPMKYERSFRRHDPTEYGIKSS